MGTILLIIGNLLLVGALPAWPVQFRLGILAQRRPRLDSLDRHNSRLNGTSVIKHASARRRFPHPSARTERRALPSPVCNRWQASQLSALNRTFAGGQNR